jgi:16S rRNA (cytosine967-C5)-methyltransferase
VADPAPGRGDVARRLAFDVLRAVDERDAYANLELARLARERRMTGRDVGFATELASGTLRMRAAYDAVIDPLVSRALDPAVRDLLRLGTHQLLSMRVPAHAAVATTVSLVRATVGHRPAGLVNAVLRRVGERSFDAWMDQLDATLTVRTSHPAWIVEALAEALDDDEELPALLRADNEPPRVTLVARPGLADVGELPGRRLAVSPYAVELEGGDPGAIPAVREQRAGVQDAGSQLVALAAVAPDVPGESAWLDLCAGPGGKAALLQALAGQRGTRVLANEVAPHRAALVRSSGVRLVVCADGATPAWPPAAFDRVLVDAPCSGLGALRRRPEARWRRRDDDLPALTALQRRLVRSAVEATRPGGIVAYATCSPVVSETVGIVGDLLAERPGLALLDAPALLPWLADARAARMPEALQLWPHRHGTDAMFVALLRVGAADARE